MPRRVPGGTPPGTRPAAQKPGWWRQPRACIHWNRRPGPSGPGSGKSGARRSITPQGRQPGGRPAHCRGLPQRSARRRTGSHIRRAPTQPQVGSQSAGGCVPGSVPTHGRTACVPTAAVADCRANPRRRRKRQAADWRRFRRSRRDPGTSGPTGSSSLTGSLQPPNMTGGGAPRAGKGCRHCLSPRNIGRRHRLVPSPMKAVGRCRRHERHLPGFLCMQVELYACSTRSGNGPLGGVPAITCTPGCPGYPCLPEAGPGRGLLKDSPVRQPSPPARLIIRANSRGGAARRRPIRSGTPNSGGGPGGGPDEQAKVDVGRCLARNVPFGADWPAWISGC